MELIAQPEQARLYYAQKLTKMKTNKSHEVCTCCLMRDRCIFGELPEEELKRRVHALRYDPGQMVFHEGNPAFGLYVVYEGKVKLFKRASNGRRQILQIVGPAGLLGEEALRENSTYLSSAQALTETKLFFIARSDMSDLLRNASVMRRLLRYLLQRLHRTEELLLATRHGSAEERLARLLLSLAQEYGRPFNGQILIELELTQTELAEMLGLTREAINKHLNTFRKAGALGYHERHMLIDQTSLERLLDTGPISASRSLAQAAES